MLTLVMIKVFLVQMKDNRPVLIDSSTVVSGEFKFSDSINFPEMHYLFFEKLQKYTFCS